jgi:prenylcysteine oxidase / farnesylcysteine lyase
LKQVNYAQNLDQIQALEALVCVYASNNQGLSVVGGNWRIFSEMILASGAKLLLETRVNGIERVDYHGKTKWRVYSNDNEDESELFDGVVLASPYVLHF